MISSVLLFLHLLHLTDTIQDSQKENYLQTKNILLTKINIPLTSLVKLVMMSHVSRSYLASKHLCEAEHPIKLSQCWRPCHFFHAVSPEASS